MRYFNVKQHRQPSSMYFGDRKVDVSELEKTATEITEEQAKIKPQWGSGNLSVDLLGKWNWEATDFDPSG